MDNSKRNVLDDNRIGLLMFKLSLPAFMGMFVMTLYNVVDTVFIGHYVGPLGIAGLSIVFPFQMLSMGLGQMTGMGGASVISRLIGAGNIQRAERALGNAVTSTVVLSLLIMIIGLSNTNLWLKLMGASDTIMPYASDYMTVILFGMVFMTVAMSTNGLVRSEGNARVAMIGMVIGAGLNIILDAIFIMPQFHLNMGIRGAALATVIAQAVSVMYFASYYLRGKSYLKIRSKELMLEWSILKDIFAIGAASLARTLAGSLSAIFVNRTLGAYGGDFAISTYGIVNRIMMFAMMPGMVIGQGLQPILGYNYGAKRYDRALKSIKIAFTVATIWCVIAFCILFFIPEPFIRIFSTDAELIDMASHAAKRIFLVLYIMGFLFVGSLTFQAMGKAVESFITALARPAIFLIPSIYILPRFLELDGVWLSFPLSDGLTLILTVVLLIPLLKKLKIQDSSATGSEYPVVQERFKERQTETADRIEL